MIRTSYANPLPALTSQAEPKPGINKTHTERLLLGVVDGVFFILGAMRFSKKEASTPGPTVCNHYNCDRC